MAANEFDTRDPEEDPGPPAVAFSGALLLASVATTGVGLWLWTVIAFVLPARDPAHIPMWRGIAVSMLAYSALTLTCLARGARPAFLRWLLTTASLAAVTVGVYGTVAMLIQAAGGGRFEGYIVLMGFVLSAHGLIGLLYSGRARGAGRPPEAP